MNDLPHKDKLQELIDKAANDVQRMADQEQDKREKCDRETAISDVLFEFRAYYGDEVPEYVEKLEEHYGSKIMQMELENMFVKPSHYEGGANRNAAYTLTVTHRAVEQKLNKAIKQELKERGELK